MRQKDAEIISWIIQNNIPFLENLLGKDNYEKVLASIPLILYVHGEKSEAAEFICEYYEKIPGQYKRYFFFLLLIARSIMEAKSLPVAYSLYGNLDHLMHANDIQAGKVYGHLYEIYAFSVMNCTIKE